MNEELVKKWLIFGIFIVLVIILATPLFIKKSHLGFTVTPVIRIDYIQNRTICDIYSIGDYYYNEINATMVWLNGSDIQREYLTVKDDYILSLRTSMTTFNLSVIVKDLEGKAYKYSADLNISHFVWHAQYYVFLNITEHRMNWNKQIDPVEIGEFPYRTTLEEMQREGRD